VCRPLLWTELTLSHSRRNRAGRLDLERATCGVVRPNGAGKTNLLELSRLFSPGAWHAPCKRCDMTRRPEALV